MADWNFRKGTTLFMHGRFYRTPLWFRVALVWMAIALVAFSSGARPKKRGVDSPTRFHQRVLLSTGGSFQFDSRSKVCVLLAVLLEHEYFFDGLVRTRGPSALEWRYSKGGQPVQEFPDSISVEVRAVPGSCPDPMALPLLPWDESLTDSMDSLQFQLHWLDGSKSIPVEVISTRSQAVPYPEDRSDPQWRYDFWIRSKNVPITYSLSIEVLSADGGRLTRVVSGMERASPLD